MKNKIYSIIFILYFIFIFNINAMQYDGQKNTFFYTIDFPDTPEKWHLVDDSKKYNAFFENENKNSFIEVTVYDLKSGSNNQDLLDYIIQRYNMIGTSFTATFCKYSAIRGEYDFNHNKSSLKMDLVIFKDKYYYYVLMGYSYKKNFNDYKETLKQIIDSCKIYYDNNVVFGNDKEENVSGRSSLLGKNKVIEKTVKSDEVYLFNVKWDKFNEAFRFLKEDLLAAKKEAADIGEYSSNGWKGWSYFKIDVENDPDRDFTFWKKFYQEAYNKNYFRVNDVYNYFKKMSDSGKYSAYELANTVIHFIQIIPYERPMNIAEKDSGTNILDYFSPNEIADYKMGDCDSKSLFMVIILRRLGFDAILFHSAKYGHVMAGININATGNYLVLDGKKYYFIESTYPDWKIGDLPPNMNDVSKWRVVPIK